VKQNAPELAFRARLKWPAFGLAVVVITGFAGFLVHSAISAGFNGGFPAPSSLRYAGLACGTDLPLSRPFDM
jgi:hypothetical protein